ncbi:methyltransferase domain-containing protein [Colletotrichum graminicola]|uniref:Methyltransferase domain-containing protein n=1 Tax=Colletotrichum graminicola (strain M1.001 / M2 / FGSC 10212) TaxID=645133 RepID=E3QHS5_COLGM|nr:methyltransferase domain-containing protein [Colletotrichum graminicola M1.001]EFQ30413.1 methyltransferase domain-containing protein [Colletotrichum graminicola M1.001]WDK18671.1 methyltransferase domain-containing protein [Colletotrichum graminicola]
MQVADNPVVMGDRNKAAPWYSPELKVSLEARRMLEEYAGIPPDKVDDHVRTMRDKIWEIFPYPCIGDFHFLDFNLAQRSSYPQMIAALQEPDARHLEIACCVGQDLRRLAHDGVDSAKTVAVELERGYIEAGYELFRDRDRLRTRFVVADLLDDGNAELAGLEGSFDTAHMGLCLHLWNREEQLAVLQRMIRLLKQRPGVMIVGAAAGHMDGVDVPGIANKPTLRHNPESWEKLWAELSEQTGTKWKLKTGMTENVGSERSWDRPGWWDREMRFLTFEVTKVE